MATRVAEWIRVSDESQAAPERFGIPAQRSVNRETCKRHGLEIIKTFEVSDVSGKDVMLSPEAAELIELMQSGRIQGVVAREFSRLMRPERFTDFSLLQTFADTHTILYLPEGPIDFSEKTGRLMGTIQAAIAGLERSTIRERLHRGNEENRKAGGRFASTLPKGVGYSKEKGWFYTEESKLVREAYDMVLAGDTLNDIARHLSMSAPGARYLLHNPIYKGWRVYDRECAEARPGKNGRQPKYRPLRKRSEDKIIRKQVIDEPLVSARTWEHACRILDIKSESARRNHQDGRGGFAAYNGFLYCDECGRTMTPIRGSGHGYYVCLGHYRHSGCKQGYTRVADMEQRVESLLTEQMTDRDFLRRLLMRLNASNFDSKRASRMQSLQAERVALERKRSRVIDMYADGDISKLERTERLARIKADMGRVNEELCHIEAQPGMTENHLVEMFRVFAAFDTLPKDDRRRLLSLYIPKIRVRDGEVVSLYRLLDRTETRYDKECSVS